MTVVLPPRLTASAETLRGAAHQRGSRTVRLPTFEVPDGLRAENVHAGPSFADAVATALGIAPLEAPADWLACLPRELTQREIHVVAIEEAYGCAGRWSRRMRLGRAGCTPLTRAWRSMSFYGPPGRWQK